jgi:non-lysosomal glucosylceramidase
VEAAMRKRGFDQWVKQTLGPSKRTVYRGDSLRAVAMPLGGLGTGSIALCGDGGLRQWQIFNQVNHQAHVPHSFFAVWARPRPGRPVAKVLQSSALYDDADFVPAATSADHVVPEESRRLLAALPGVAEIEFVGEYPVAEITYRDPDLPVEVSLEAFSPMVPLNAKDSGLPAVLFRFTARNPGERELEVSLAATLQNAVGYGGVEPIAGVECPDYGGNTNLAIGLHGLTGLYLIAPGLASDDPRNGTMVLATTEEDASLLAQWDDPQALWRQFSETGRTLETRPTGSSPAGRTWNAALAVPFTLGPGEAKTVTFLLGWHFPNRLVNWGQTGFGVADTKTRFWLGNAYARWFQDALGLAEYVRDNLHRLTSETRLFRDTFYDSTLPYWLLDAVSSQASIVRSPTVMWTGDGNFHGFEGCGGASTTPWLVRGGCCPLNCTHVWNYEQSLSRLYPDLERTMRRTDLLVQLSPEGAIPHRTVLPLYLSRWPDGGPGSETVAADGHFGTVLKAYREYLISGDRAFLDEVWPAVRKAMAYGMDRWDPDGDGLLDGPQWNTYDLNFYGHNTFCSGFYLAALRAAEEMALIEGERGLAQDYRARFQSGAARLDERLWNGEYYRQRYDAHRYREKQYGEGCLADQMIGQWWAHLLDLGYLFPEERVRSALDAVWRHNFRRDFVGFKQQRVFASDRDKGLLICTWPRGGRPERPMYYCDEVWTGIEYQVASHLMMEGLVDEGLEIVRVCRDRYDGRVRNPFNEYECGHWYARALSSYALLEGLTGARYDAVDKTLYIDSRVGDDFRSFLATATGFGTVGLDGGRPLVDVKHGRIDVEEVIVSGRRAAVGR